MSFMKSASELQRNMGAVYELCRASSEPVYITRNGHADLVVMDARAFEERDTLQRAAHERELRRQESIARGYEQARAGKLKPLSQVRAERDAS